MSETKLEEKKIVIGISGGVDSSAAAYLLKQQGYEVIGVHIHMHDYSAQEAMNDETGSLLESDDARNVANHLGIEYVVLDAADLFRRRVTDYFVEEYYRGHTPNPCNICNRYVKFATLLEYADSCGAAYIATGHYADISKLPGGRYTISNSATAQKDQTYALCRLSQEQLARIIMPLAKYTKDQVRSIAREAGIPVAEKKDSQDICFIPDGDYGRFLRQYDNREDIKGHFIHENGTDYGPHEGISHYTIGQRRGLGIPAGERIFVKSIDASGGNIILSDNEALFTSDIRIREVMWMGTDEAPDTFEALVKIRYAHKGTMAKLTRVSEDEYAVVFEEPVRAATPGQFAVFYKDGYIAGSGIIA